MWYRAQNLAQILKFHGKIWLVQISQIVKKNPHKLAWDQTPLAGERRIWCNDISDPGQK